MNVAVITRHTPCNYGSLLQSIAITKVIQFMGHKAEIIDYRRYDDGGMTKVWTEACIKYNSFFKRLSYLAVRYPIELIAEVRFEKMRKEFLPLTNRCCTHEELSALEADVFLTGSDQVWGPMVNGKYDNAYFLEFVRGKKKVSYAASFGKTKFNDETINNYKELLSSYDKITVREDSAVFLLKSWGLTNCVGQVLDPTLLLTGDEWRTFGRLERNINQPYVLVYQLHNDPRLSSYAKELAKKMNMGLVRVNPFLHQAGRGGHFYCCPDAREFLRLINNSSMMITDSFHGTCFAINLNKQFVEVLPNNATGTRNQSILKLTGLSGRIVTDFSCYDIADNPVDYTPVNRILDMERAKSRDILKYLLN